MSTLPSPLRSRRLSCSATGPSLRCSRSGFFSTLLHGLSSAAASGVRGWAASHPTKPYQDQTPVHQVRLTLAFKVVCILIIVLFRPRTAHADTRSVSAPKPGGHGIPYSPPRNFSRKTHAPAPAPPLSPYNARSAALHAQLVSAFARAAAEPPPHLQQIAALERAATALSTCAGDARLEARRLRELAADASAADVRASKRERWMAERRGEVLSAQAGAVRSVLDQRRTGATTAQAQDVDLPVDWEAEKRAANMRTFFAIAETRAPYPSRYRRRRPSRDDTMVEAERHMDRIPVSPTVTAAEDDAASASTAVSLPPTPVSTDHTTGVVVIAKPLEPFVPKEPKFIGDDGVGSATVYTPRPQHKRTRTQILQTVNSGLDSVPLPAYALDLLDSFDRTLFNPSSFLLSPPLPTSQPLAPSQPYTSAAPAPQPALPPQPASPLQPASLPKPAPSPQPAPPPMRRPPMLDLALCGTAGKQSIDSVASETFSLLSRPSGEATDQLPTEFGARRSRSRPLRALRHKRLPPSPVDDAQPHAVRKRLSFIIIRRSAEPASPVSLDSVRPVAPTGGDGESKVIGKLKRISKAVRL